LPVCGIVSRRSLDRKCLFAVSCNGSGANNADWVVPAGAHERRFVVQEVANSHRQDPNWFGPIYEQLKTGGYEAMLFDLLERDLGDWHPRQIVRTAALAWQQEKSLSPLDTWWFELL
jgi:hypothetical protein